MYRDREWMWWTAGILLALGIVLAAVASSRNTVAYVPAQPSGYVDGTAPVIVQPAPVIVHDNSSGFWHGMWMGHALSGGNTHTVHEVHHVSPAPSVVYRGTPSVAVPRSVPTVTVSRSTPTVNVPRAVPTVSVPRSAPSVRAYSAPRTVTISRGRR